MSRVTHRWIVALCAFVALAGLMLVVSHPAAGVRTEDLNRDGRPDVWRAFDANGWLARVDVDTNFDGRSDVQEYYEAGTLVRREWDRDFNDRVDLIQQFEPSTSDTARIVDDVDFDGSADVLILFASGKPVFTEWTHSNGSAPAPPPVRAADDRLATLVNPFLGDIALHGVPQETFGDSAEGTRSGGLPGSALPSSGLVAVRTTMESPVLQPCSPFLPHASSRGPPRPLLS